mmetsp:Transcript_5913/g.11737  ORF Transcript_5913/g.11737 Transcript_5913/m.11737 type:complete len:83 (-) Transcript_5913:665-913(-)
MPEVRERQEKSHQTERREKPGDRQKEWTGIEKKKSENMTASLFRAVPLTHSVKAVKKKKDIPFKVQAMHCFFLSFCLSFFRS